MPSACVQDPKPLIFCHFARGLGDKMYDEVNEYQALYKTLMEALMEYNETNAVMDLVLFEDAMKHICRISRIISNPSGHALLVGVGGSGKQSLSRLAGYICGYAPVSIVISGSYNMNNFKEDLQKMYKRAGMKGEGIMFLFTDSQVSWVACGSATFGPPCAGTGLFPCSSVALIIFQTDVTASFASPPASTSPPCLTCLLYLPCADRGREDACVHQRLAGLR